MRIKKRNFFIFSICAFIALSFLLPLSTLTANAMSDDWYPPTCELDIDDNPAIALSSKISVITYANGNASLQTTYKLNAASATTLNCTLPVFCQQFEVSNFEASLSVNGTAITPTYGYSSYNAVVRTCETYADILALREQLSELDRSIKVHEFTVTSSAETRFKFSLQATDRMLYTFNRHSYTAATREYDVKVTPSQPCVFLVFGNKPNLDLSESCSVKYTEKSIDTFIAETVEFMTEMTNGIDCTDLVTHKVNEFITAGGSQSTDFIIDSCAKNSYAFLDYAVALPLGESTIVVSQPMAVGLNSLFAPKVYVGKVYCPAQTAPLSLSVNTEEYVVSCTLDLKNNAYNGEAPNEITMSFCEVKNPTLVNTNGSVQWEPWRIAVLTVGCVIGAVSIVVLIVQLVKWKKSK